MARDQQFCLRWNNYQTNLGQVFEQLLHAEVFVDVTITCEGNSIRAHRIILSSCSPYFHSVLQDNPCSHPIIILQGVKWTELKAIIEFMYKGEINIGQDQLPSLLQVAESLKVRGLADVGGDETEAVLTSPSESPRGSSNFWSDANPPKKKRKLSEDDGGRSSSRSRSPRSPSPRVHTPTSAAEVLEATMDIPISLSRSSSSSITPNPPPAAAANLPSPSPVASLASSLSSLAHLHAGPMPPPGPHLPAHLAHLPPLSPLSPLLNMHPMSRHHSPEDFEIRPGIAEMIREEERVSEKMMMHHPQLSLPDHRPFKFPKRRDIPDMAKILESTHHWIGNPMADSYQAQVQAAWQKSWNQTQSLLQNLRFRERGPLKSWRPETMAEAIHAVLKEGLSLSQAARKFDIPYPTFVLYANRVHNLLGPSHEPGDLRPKGRGRPQRILLGSWPDDQIKGVIRAVVFRDTTVFNNSDHKENKKPPQLPKVVESPSIPNGPTTPSSNGTSASTPEGSTTSSPSTSTATQPLPPPGSSNTPSDVKMTPLSSPVLKKEPEESSPVSIPPGPSSAPGSNSAPGSVNCVSPSNGSSFTHNSTANSPRGVAPGPQTPQSRPSSTSSNGSQNQMNGVAGYSLPQSSPSGSITKPTANSSDLTVSTSCTNGQSPPVPNSNSQMSGMPSLISKSQSALPNQILQGSLHNHFPPHANSQQHHHQGQQRSQALPLFPQQTPHTHQQPNHLQQSRNHGQSGLAPIPSSGHQQMMGLIAGSLPSAPLAASPIHMARLYGEGSPHIPSRPQHTQPPLNTFHPGFPSAGHPTMQPMGLMNPMNSLNPRLGVEEAELSPEAMLFGKVTSSPPDKHSFNSESNGSRQIHNQFEGTDEGASPGSVERSLMFRDGLDIIKSEPEAIMN